MLRKWVVTIAIVAAASVGARADDDARKVLDKAVQALGGAELLKKTKDKSVHQHSKITVSEMNIEGKMETFTTGKKFKHIIDINVNGMDIKQEVCFDEKELWIAVNGKVAITLSKDEQVAAVREAIFADSAVGKAMLGDKSIECSIIGEGKVEDKPATGVRLTSKGHKDVSAWFDKKSGLLVKIESRGVEFQSGQEVAEERIINEYKEVEGYKRPSRISVHRDGKKVAEIEVTETKLLDNLDDSTFAKPG